MTDVEHADSGGPLRVRHVKVRLHAGKSSIGDIDTVKETGQWVNPSS